MAQSFTHRFHVPIYDCRIWVFSDKEKFRQFVRRKTGNHEVTKAFVFDSDGLTVFDGPRIYIGCFDRNIGTLAHEAVHAANHILSRASVPFDKENDEPLAYLVGFVMAQSKG